MNIDPYKHNMYFFTRSQMSQQIYEYFGIFQALSVCQREGEELGMRVSPVQFQIHAIVVCYYL